MNKSSKTKFDIAKYRTLLNKFANFTCKNEEKKAITKALVSLIDRYQGEDGSNTPNKKQLETIQDICDEYVIMSGISYKHTTYVEGPYWNVEDIAEIPDDLKKSIVDAAKEPSEREQRIRQNIGCLLEK